MFINILKKIIVEQIIIMVEQIKLIYKLKGFDTKYFTNNESEKNALLIMHQVLKKYYQIIMKKMIYL